MEESGRATDANELIRLRNIAESRQILAELGLHKSWQVQFNSSHEDNTSDTKSETENDAQAIEVHQQEKKPRSKSSKRKRRLRHSPRFKQENERHYHQTKQNLFGHIPGIPVGEIWASRLECCIAGVHRYPVAGIHGHPLYGCYSIALSGGYEDDLDLGDCFTYTGEGGRSTGNNNPKIIRTTPQVKDMMMTRGNLALTRNIKTRKPVRVIRGFQLQSPYAPLLGYRYDGLYFVEKYWECIGQSGFRTIKFALRRCENQDPPPWISRIVEVAMQRFYIDSDVLVYGTPPGSGYTVLIMLPRYTCPREASPDSGYNSPESTSDCVPSLELPLADEELDMIELDCRAADIDVDCDLETLNLNSTTTELCEIPKRKSRSAAKAVRRRRKRHRKSKVSRNHSYGLRRSSTRNIS